MTGPLDWAHPIDAAAAGLEVRRAATVEECAAVADALGIVSCEALDVRYAVNPRSAGRFRVTGHLEARVTQACIVSLDPVVETLSEDFEVEFRPEAATRASRRIAGAGDDPEADASILDADEIETIENGRLDVGRIVYECLATALDPYPRAAGVELEQSEAGGDNAEASHPFAALAKLKRDG
jgi:uncharacterized metal-binding protein YceD (DUF177 family)